MNNFTYDIAFYECLEEEQQQIQQQLENSRFFFTEKTIQEEGHSEPLAPLLSIRTVSVIPLSWATKLEAILTRSTGYDKIKHYREQTQTTIPGGYLPLYSQHAVAEHATLLSLALLRKLPQQLHAMTTFSRDALTGRESKNKTAAVLGIGNIGYEIVGMLTGLGMHCIGVDIAPRYSDITYQPLEQAVSQADLIVCSMNLCDSTQGLLNRDIWANVKPRSLFVNVSRGEISPFVDLKEALDKGQLAAIGMDVFNEESNVFSYLRGTNYQMTPELEAFITLMNDERVLFTPHNAFNTMEAVERKSQQTIQQIQSWQRKRKFLWHC